MTIEKPCSLTDWNAIREICCITGNDGEPIDLERWPFFAELWIGPYQKLLPEWTSIARDESGRIVGYLTGCPDTQAFERCKFWRHTLPLLFRMSIYNGDFTADMRRLLRRTLGFEEAPSARFSEQVTQTIRKRYPAHLHINLDAAFRGQRLGDRLLEQFVKDLRQARVPGVHVYCGVGPLPFYRRVGFTELERIRIKLVNTQVVALGLDIDAMH